MTLPLIEKYRVKTFEDIKGQETAIQDVINFYKSFPRKKALILNGPVGVGKTSIVLAMGKELNLELFELNASDLRNKSKLEEVLKPATNQQSLFNRGKLILMDEADGITASDRGGLPELITIIEKTNFPIIITANDIWQKKFGLLRQKCQMINLKELKDPIIVDIIENILKKEKRTLKKEVILLIAKKARGDVRSALNDLESALSLGEDAFVTEIFEREKQEDIFNILKKLFQSPTNESTINLFDNSNLDMDEITLWIEENIPIEYQGKALVKAYDYLSKADIFKGRIYRQQHWRFLVYQNFFLTAGISSATKLKGTRYQQYKQPSRILKIWLSNQKNAKKKSIVEKYAKFAHMSKKKAMRDYFILPLILNKNNINKIDLEEDEIKYLEEKKAAIIVANGLNKFRI
ncbi:MAG: replication factor C large subunit [Candidatus Pacearchaeota archaeon]|jgi:replication factor C large subunit